MSAVTVCPDAGFGIQFSRVGVDFGEDRTAQSCLFKQIKCVLRDRKIRKPPVSDQQRLPDARCDAGLPDLGDTTGAEADRRGIGPVGAR